MSYQNARSWSSTSRRRLHFVSETSSRRRRFRGRSTVHVIATRPPRRTKRRAAASRTARSRPDWGSSSASARRARTRQGRAGEATIRLRGGQRTLAPRVVAPRSIRERRQRGSIACRGRVVGGVGRTRHRGEPARARSPGARRTDAHAAASERRHTFGEGGACARVSRGCRCVGRAARRSRPRSRDASNLQRFPAKRTQGAESATRSRVTDGRVFPTRPKHRAPQRTAAAESAIPRDLSAEMMTAEIATDAGGERVALSKGLSQRAHFENRCFRCLGETRGGRVVSVRARTSTPRPPFAWVPAPRLHRTMGVPSFSRSVASTSARTWSMYCSGSRPRRAEDKLDGVKSTVDTKLVRHARPKKSSSRCRSGRAAPHAAARGPVPRGARGGAPHQRPEPEETRGRHDVHVAAQVHGAVQAAQRNRAAHRAADPSHAFHAKQVANMRRRIAEQNTLVERKKNVYDTTLNPVVLRPKTASAARRAPWGFSSGPICRRRRRADPPRRSRPRAPRGRPRRGRRTRASHKGCGDAQGCSRRLRVLDVAEGKPGDGAHAADAPVPGARAPRVPDAAQETAARDRRQGRERGGHGGDLRGHAGTEREPAQTRPESRHRGPQGGAGVAAGGRR